MSRPPQQGTETKANDFLADDTGNAILVEALRDLIGEGHTDLKLI